MLHYLIMPHTSIFYRLQDNFNFVEGEYGMTNVLNEETEKSVITTDALVNGGKKNPASLNESGIKDEDEEDEKIKLYIPLIKANIEEKTVTGVVLQPEVVDAQGDIISAEVIRKAAHNFLKKYNKATTLGLQHKVFSNTGFELCESWITPQEVVINGTTIKEGAWVMTVFVGNSKAWELVKNGKLKGFSIGGKAKAVKVKENKNGK